MAACAPAAGQTAATPTPAPMTTAPADEAAGTASSAVGDAGITYGRTDDGAFFQGAADAPVTLIDYSDFL